ncbi:MAG: 50S ribosomal protein L31 [Candidatus Yanofskybacteria bacterium RIFCSPHIGHO2_12_FULL_45_19b]|uniref:Large ribosomal subunit protein bL31 n=1 Tax=Candidatus Yanofskybacteria bacterium RIFCSPHIGHO2_12_FULL_45_19b TaxID=1802689 RepID=A0A1F8G207_9BACT|nr:MAG: 50S ribosomal protein L31 [Candidatus Yanofskybacteria bacterium RIFCSPHIGHO2_12_FULL_45_19b]
MKKGLHPTYYPEAKVSCACGQSWTTGSTLPELKVEICSNCHPFYSGKEKILDTRGRVDKFRKRAEKSQIKQDSKITKKTVKKAKAK